MTNTKLEILLDVFSPLKFTVVGGNPGHEWILPFFLLTYVCSHSARTCRTGINPNPRHRRSSKAHLSCTDSCPTIMPGAVSVMDGEKADAKIELMRASDAGS